MTESKTGAKRDTSRHKKQALNRTSCNMSWVVMALSTFFLLVSCTSPPKRNSSNIKYACRPPAEVELTNDSTKRIRCHQQISMFSHLFKVKDYVELADAAKVLIEQLHIAVDNLKRNKLVVVLADGCAEVQACISMDISMAARGKGK